MKGVFITGTDTDVGETWVGQKIIQQLTKNGVSVEPRKPVESGWPVDITLSDAWKLSHAANKEEKLDAICPNRFLAAISPDRAAKIEGKYLRIDQLSTECTDNFNPEKDFLYVEGAGGFYSPLCSDGLNADLAKTLKLPVILVVGDRLGCINHALLSIEAIEKAGLSLLGVVLNNIEVSKPDSLNMNNYKDLSEKIDYPLISFENSSEPAKQICRWLDL